MQKYGDWELLEPPLGQGGQSVVYLARSPERVKQRKASASVLSELSGLSLNTMQPAVKFSKAVLDLAREDLPSELGALKVFKIRQGGAPAQERLKREIAVLREKRTNLPKLLDANEAEQWMVTEYFPHGTLAKSPLKYRGEPILALKAFRTLVETVANSLHNYGDVHRDIKPANVFVGIDGTLIPGDFGIVYLSGQADRPTVTDERVGPWEYMPQWADLGERLEKVEPSFDVYMLSKLLWCMVAGRLRLPREYHRRPGFDLSVLFANNKHVHLVNSILDKCLVEEPKQCLPSAHELLKVVDDALATIESGAPLRDEKGRLVLPCRVCGKGFYQEERLVGLHQVTDERNMPVSPIRLRLFTCNVCTHREFFAPGYPDEAAARVWTAWTPLKT